MWEACWWLLRIIRACLPALYLKYVKKYSVIPRTKPEGLLSVFREVNYG